MCEVYILLHEFLIIGCCCSLTVSEGAAESAKSEGGDDDKGAGATADGGVAAEGEERELTKIEKDISEYLARLVAHIVAGTPMLPPSMRGEAG